MTTTTPDTITLAQVEAILARHDRMKNSYFWTPPGSAADRRRMEARESIDLAFTYRGDAYSIAQDVTCSCRNVYYRLSVTRNGVRKDVRAVRALARDLAAAAN